MCVILDRWLCILTGVAGAVLASQLPGYTLQYMQNLRGRLDELEPMVREFELDVMQYNYTIDEALVECETASGFLDALCNSFETTVLRWEELREHYTLLEQASDYKRPFTLMGSAKRDIAQSVAREFEPAIPASDQGFLYALVGFLLLSGAVTFLFHLLRCMCCRKPTSRRNRMSKQQRLEEDDDDDEPHFDTTDMTAAKKAPASNNDALADRVPAENPEYNPSKDQPDHRNDVDTERGAHVTNRAQADGAENSGGNDDNNDKNKPRESKDSAARYSIVGALYQTMFATKKDNYRRYVNTESGLAVPTINRTSNYQNQDISIRIIGDP